LSISNVQSKNAGNYLVTVSNAAGVAASVPAKLVVRASVPYFTVQPASLSMLFGSTATLTSLAAGTQPLHYQWYFQGRALRNQTNTLLSLYGVTTAFAGNYYVMATNSVGRTTSAIAQLTINVPPQPVRPLANQIVQVGGNVTLALSVNGNSPMSYSWQWNGIPFPCTNSVLRITNIEVNSSGYYQVTAVIRMAAPRRSPALVSSPHRRAW